jgi:hypothetical protein
VAILALVDSRLPAARARSLQAGLLRMGHAAAETEMLSQLRLSGFVMPRFPGAATPP